MRIVFFGTPYFAAVCLKDLLANVVAVVTQPDRPKGRSLQMTFSPVKEIALQKGIPIFQPEKSNTPEFLEELTKLNADLFVVVAFGQILSQKLLDIPPLGCINVHASLLPKYRGAAPIQRVLMAGEKETGIAIQKMVKQLDAGDVIAVSKVLIPEEMTFQELEQALLQQAKILLVEVIRRYEKGVPSATAQNHEEATYAAKITPEDAEIQWTWPSVKIHNHIRALFPRPGAWVKLANGKRLKILRGKKIDAQGRPGELLGPEATIGCQEGAIQLLEVQPEGKKAMSGADWLRGISQNNSIFDN